MLKDANSTNKILLLEGRPGCGKTILTRKISRDWGEGALLKLSVSHSSTSILCHTNHWIK